MTTRTKGAFAMEMRLTDYPAYWAYYITQHRQSGNRVLHYIGSACLVAFVTEAIVIGIWTPLPAALAAAFVPGLVGHVLFEKSPPEKHHYPVWAVLSDLRMLGLSLTGRLARTFDLPGVRRRAVPGASASEG